MPRSNLAKTITLRVSLVPRLQVYHKEEITKDPRATNEDFGGFLNDKLEQLLDKENMQKETFQIVPSYQSQTASSISKMEY